MKTLPQLIILTVSNNSFKLNNDADVDAAAAASAVLVTGAAGPPPVVDGRIGTLLGALAFVVVEGAEVGRECELSLTTLDVPVAFDADGRGVARNCADVDDVVVGDIEPGGGKLTGGRVEVGRLFEREAEGGGRCEIETPTPFDDEADDTSTGGGEPTG